MAQGVTKVSKEGPEWMQVVGDTLQVQQWASGLLDNLEHRNSSVGLAGNDIRLAGIWEARIAGNNMPQIWQTERKASRPVMSVMHVSV